MKKIYILFILIYQVSVAQKNDFLNREFWKANPTIKTIYQKINAGNDPVELNRFGFDAVVYALLENTNNRTLEYLLSIKGNSVDKLTHDGRTYLFWAVYKNNIEFVKYLIEKGAKMDIIDDKGYSVINFAATTGQQNTELYDILLKHGATIDGLTPKGANALLLLAPNLNNLDFISYFTTKGLSLSSIDNNGNGIFNYAVTKGNKQLLSSLIEKGLPYKNLNKMGGNAMLFATRGSRKGYNSLAFFKYLETLGINPNITNRNGKTPLHNLAYSNTDTESYAYFITKGVDANQANKDGDTPLLQACYKNSLEVISFLLKHTDAINHSNKKGITALTNAIKGNSPKIIELLLKNGADVSVLDKKGNNLMSYLIESYSHKNEKAFNHKIVVLETSGLDVSAIQKNGNTLYHLAIKKQSIALLKCIKKFNQNINAKNNDGYTVLQKTVLIAKNTDIIKYLIEEGANINVMTAFKESIYDLAKENESLKNEDLEFLKITL